METVGRNQTIISQDSRVGDVITVRTLNTTYVLTVTDPTCNDVNIEGGRWPKPTLATIYGGHLEVGGSMHIAPTDNDSWVVSSTIRSIAVTRG